MQTRTAKRYDTVIVHEPGIEPWRGEVRAIKPPRPESRPDKAGKVRKLDQWAEVRRESDGLEWAIPLTYLEVLEEEEVADGNE